MCSGTTMEREQAGVGGHSLTDLCDMAARGLRPMLDPAKLMFCYSYVRTGSDLTRVGLSPRYTMMTLLGLHRYETSGHPSPVAIAPVLQTLLQDTQWVDGAGDLGLLLWTCAELAPNRISQIYNKFHAEDALARFADGQLGYTMEVAWYLTGLVACLEASGDALPGIFEQIRAAKQILKQNCGAGGVYGHCSRSKPPAGYIRRRLGSFADQVYPTIALARLSLRCGDLEAREMALSTTTTMCELQGSLGEWSWQYDSGTARVMCRYPVFSVHQHAMAPMMLFAAGEAGGRDFSDAIYKGLAWISGSNELRIDFIQPDFGLVWRSIYLSSVNKYSDAALRFFRMRSGAANAKPNVRYECRPYELGWLLYALAGK
jgi:hypothetical protein